MENLIITRASQFINRARKITIYLNGEKFESLGNDEMKKLKLENGTHQIYAQIDWCKTVPLDLIIDDNSTILLELGSELNPFNPFSTFYTIFFNTTNYLYLREVKL